MDMTSLWAMVSFEGENWTLHVPIRLRSYPIYLAKPISNQYSPSSFSPEWCWKAGKSTKLLQDFPHVLSIVRQDNFEPSIIAKICDGLAPSLAQIYATTRILDESPERDSRLALNLHNRSRPQALRLTKGRKRQRRYRQSCPIVEQSK